MTALNLKAAFPFAFKRNKGWCKVVEGLDPDLNNGWAVLGRFVVHKNGGTDLPVGTCLLVCNKTPAEGPAYGVYEVDDAGVNCVGATSCSPWYPSLKAPMQGVLLRSLGHKNGRSRCDNDKRPPAALPAPYPRRGNNPSGKPRKRTTFKTTVQPDGTVESDVTTNETRELREKVAYLEGVLRPALNILREIGTDLKPTKGTDDEPVWLDDAREVYENLFLHFHPELDTQPTEKT